MSRGRKKKGKRFIIVLIITSALVGGIIYNFVLVALGLLEKSLAVNAILDIIISPLSLLIGAWIGADTMGKSSVLKNIFPKKK